MTSRMTLGSVVRFVLCTLSLGVSALWPMPKHFSKGNTTLLLDEALHITYNGAPLPYKSAYQPASLEANELVIGGVSRIIGSIFQSKFMPWMLHPRGAKFEPDAGSAASLVSLTITRTGRETPTNTNATTRPRAGEVDEAYNLTISAAGEAALSAASSAGILHGLETFSQLFYAHSDGKHWYTPYAPVSVQDSPKFPHRGILLDVARNYFPMSKLLSTVDAMAWNKMNKLHVHVTDSQSWPLVLPSMPEVAEKGAYRPDYVYTPSDVEKLQLYGAHRGVEVIFEIDMPGHIGALALSHPELVVAYNAKPYTLWCAEPPCGAFKLNNSGVDAFLGKLFDDLLPRLASYSAYFHTGGDELNAQDSTLDPGVGTNSTDVLKPLLQKFMDVQHGRIRSHGMTPITWQEIPLQWNVKMGKDTVVQAWLGAESVKKLTSAGHKVIDSDYNFWYLDCGRGDWVNFNADNYNTSWPFNDWCGPAKSWQLVYSHDPTANLTADQAKLVLGGEVAVWTETIDAVNVDVIVWPRASAAGESLWSGIHDAAGQNRSQLEVAPRLNEMRSLMVARGVGAAPIQMTFCTQSSPEDCLEA